MYNIVKFRPDCKLNPVGEGLDPPANLWDKVVSKNAGWQGLDFNENFYLKRNEHFGRVKTLPYEDILEELPWEENLN